MARLLGSPCETRSHNFVEPAPRRKEDTVHEPRPGDGGAPYPVWATRLLALVTADPVAARKEASERLEAARMAGDPVAESSALRVLGHVAREGGHIDEALLSLQQAVAVAEAAGHVEL